MISSWSTSPARDRTTATICSEMDGPWPWGVPVTISARGAESIRAEGGSHRVVRLHGTASRVLQKILAHDRIVVDVSGEGSDDGDDLCGGPRQVPAHDDPNDLVVIVQQHWQRGLRFLGYECQEGVAWPHRGSVEARSLLGIVVPDQATSRRRCEEKTDLEEAEAQPGLDGDQFFDLEAVTAAFEQRCFQACGLSSVAWLKILRCAVAIIDRIGDGLEYVVVFEEGGDGDEERHRIEGEHPCFVPRVWPDAENVFTQALYHGRVPSSACASQRVRTHPPVR